jgi:hypothetical protein
MTTSTATTEFDVREALRQHFEKNGLANFEKNIKLLQELNFYKHVLAKLEQGVDLSDELPELRKLKIQSAKKILKQLIAESEKAATLVWESPFKLFRTSVRYSIDESSLLPNFDVLYVAKVSGGTVKIALNTWRRNLTVSVEGKEADCETVHGQLVLAVMREIKHSNF